MSASDNSTIRQFAGKFFLSAFLLATSTLFFLGDHLLASGRGADLTAIPPIILVGLTVFFYLIKNLRRYWEVAFAFFCGTFGLYLAWSPLNWPAGFRINILDVSGTLNDQVPDAYKGLDRFEARKRIVHDLEEQGLLQKTDTHTHSVGRCYRCDTVIEPYLSWQWFVKMAPLAAPAIEAAKKGQVKFFPARWKKVYLHWLENIRDWCISGQLWWGHRIPVWYRGEEMVVSVDRPEGEGWVQDEDVLDTWFSSWLWPFAILGWPEETEDLKRFYPNALMVTPGE